MVFRTRCSSEHLSLTQRENRKTLKSAEIKSQLIVSSGTEFHILLSDVYYPITKHDRKLALQSWYVEGILTINGTVELNAKLVLVLKMHRDGCLAFS